VLILISNERHHEIGRNHRAALVSAERSSDLLFIRTMKLSEMLKQFQYCGILFVERFPIKGNRESGGTRQ
jgi:hypothetical protein